MKNEDSSQAIACNGVPIFDGHGGILSTDDAIHLEYMWEKSENYKRNHSSLLNNSPKVSLEQQIQSASICTAGAQPASKVKAMEPELEI